METSDMALLKNKQGLFEKAGERLREGHGVYVHKMSYSGATKGEDVATAIEEIESVGWLMVDMVANEAILMIMFRPCNCGEPHGSE
jgi:hypothetical protein